MPIDLFLQQAFDPASRFFYFAWLLVCVVSITLHELAHGWAAIRAGDDTPLELGRMTGNPLVHMGPFSLVALVLFGMAWGAMPINSGRLRGKYAEAQVAFAGPSVNLTLGLLSLIALGLCYRFGPAQDGAVWIANLYELLWVAGYANLVLFVFNLMPVPPLDGSHILANFHEGYARFISDPSKQGAFLLMFAGVFMLGTYLWAPIGRVADALVAWVMMVGM